MTKSDTRGIESTSAPRPTLTNVTPASPAEQIVGFRIMREAEIAPGWWATPVAIRETSDGTEAFQFCDEQNAKTMKPTWHEPHRYFVDPIFAEPDADMNDLLRQVVAQQIGPRKPGVIYDNVDGRFEVLNVITDRTEARRVLRRKAAQFAVIIRDTLRPDGQPFPVGSVWTGSDRVLKAVA